MASCLVRSSPGRARLLFSIIIHRLDPNLNFFLIEKSRPQSRQRSLKLEYKPTGGSECFLFLRLVTCRKSSF